MGGGSQGDYVVFVRNGKGIRCTVFWQSKRLPRVVKSTMAAETLGLVRVHEAGVYVQKGIFYMVGKRCVLETYVDNMNLVKVLKSSHQVEDKRLRMDLALVVEVLEWKGFYQVVWVNTKDQVAYCRTKSGSSVDLIQEWVSFQSVVTIEYENKVSYIL